VLHYRDLEAGIVVRENNTSGSRWLLASLRFVTLFALSIWVGGVIFLGAIMAPAAFGISRALGPQLVGAALARFTPLIYVCGVLMLLAWAIEGWMNRRNGGSRATGRKLWWAQGACTLGMLVLALYLGQVLTPRINSLQRFAISTGTRDAPVGIGQKVESDEVQATNKAAFDVAHQRYTQVTKLNLWLGIATLFLLSLRLSSSHSRHDEEYSDSPSSGRKASEEDILVATDVR
jgi:uncharacterized membrane protein